MSIDIILPLLLFALAVGWWTLSREKEYQVAKTNSEIQAKPTNMEVSLEMSPEEKLAESLHAARKAIEEKARAERSEISQQLKEMKQKLQSSKELSDSLGISHAITKIVEEMDHWPAWSKNTKYDFSKNLVDGLIYKTGGIVKRDEKETTTNLFSFKHNSYRLSLADKHWGYGSTEKYAEIVLEKISSDNALIVYKAEVVQDGSQDCAPWQIVHVTTLNLGDWTHDIVSLDALFAARKEKERLERDLEYYGSKAKKLIT